MKDKHLARLITLLGGYQYSPTVVYFDIQVPVSNDGGETITDSDALFIEDVMLALGYEGTTIGHPLDERDDTYITFRKPLP